MQKDFGENAAITARRIGPEDWRAYRDFLKGLKEPQHFSGIMEGRDLDAPETYEHFFRTIGDLVMFGLWDGERMVGQTSLFIEDGVAVFEGSERADDYEGKRLGDIFYETRKQYLKQIGHTGKVITTIRPVPEREASFKAAKRNGFVDTGELNKHGCCILELAE